MSIRSYKTNKGKKYQVRWYEGYYDNGKPKPHTKGNFETLKAAKIFESQRTLNIINPLMASKSKKVTFKALYESWFESYQNTVEVTTVARTEALFRLHLLPKFGEMSLDSISPLACQTAINNWAQTYRNIKQLRSYCALVFEYGVDMDLLARNPMKNVSTPKRERNRKVDDKIWSIDELNQFLEIVAKEEPYKHQVLFRLLAFCGMRKGELAALKWTDIDFRTGVLSINKNLALVKHEYILKKPKNASSERLIELDKETLQMLKKWQAIQSEELEQLSERLKFDSHNFVFTYLNSKAELLPIHQDYANNVLDRIIKRHKLKHLTVHGFRHTFATITVENGGDIVNLSKRLGHASVKTTLETYSHPTTTGQKETLRIFTGALNRDHEEIPQKNV